MSDSNSSNTVTLDIVLTLPSVVRTLLQTLNVEVDKDMAILRKSKRDNNQMTTSIRIPETTLSMGLMKMKTYTTCVEMAQMMFLLISE